MAGASFVRADLHVHTYKDTEAAPSPDLAAYIDAAVGCGLDVLAITDHNTTQFVQAAMKAATDTPVLVLPGIEISTHDGHLLAIFSPAAVAELEALANPTNLSLTMLSETEKRSARSMLDLVQEVHSRGGLAIPAHIDASHGIHQQLKPAELAELLASPALAGLEFQESERLKTWFTDGDSDPHRLAAWKARQAVPELKARGLARLMSSDAHTPQTVGQDRARRTLTRLRLDDPNFDAVRNAIAHNPKARCKAEAVLPVTYPNLLSAQFDGGFLDGVSLEFSPNLNCLIGGRGSGKSTALLAIRAALGAHLGPNEDPDEVSRMPDRTIVRFVDRTGSERAAVRERGGTPYEEDEGSQIRLRLADLGQDESGRLARGYEDSPELLLAFLDNFLTRHAFDEREEELLAKLADNASELRRTAVAAATQKKHEDDKARLEANLKAAQKGRIEEIAVWARLLAAEAPFLERLDAALAAAAAIAGRSVEIDIDDLAGEFGIDLTQPRAIGFVEGDGGLRSELASFHTAERSIREASRRSLQETLKGPQAPLGRWKADHAELKTRLEKKQAELEQRGLKVQAGAVRDIADRLNALTKTLGELRTKQRDHAEALKARETLLGELRSNRVMLFEARRAVLKKIADAANSHSDGLTIRVYFEREGLDEQWVRWLSSKFGFRSPRVHRLAAKVSPAELAQQLRVDRSPLLALTDDNGDLFFTSEALGTAYTWDHLFELDTMRLEDRPRIETQESGSPERKQLDRLSAGQQRSVLLSLLLCAERPEPLILDQPEDHLDARYIASAVVRHLEAAKERRQIVIATHSPNLTVLGDAELVIPMRLEDGKGRPHDAGAVDRPATRNRVCELLEGGAEAYRKRGQRYGFQFAG